MASNAAPLPSYAFEIGDDQDDKEDFADSKCAFVMGSSRLFRWKIETKQTWDDDQSENESNGSQADDSLSGKNVKDVENVFKVNEEAFAAARETKRAVEIFELRIATSGRGLVPLMACSLYLEEQSLETLGLFK